MHQVSGLMDDQSLEHLFVEYINMYIYISVCDVFCLRSCDGMYNFPLFPASLSLPTVPIVGVSRPNVGMSLPPMVMDQTNGWYLLGSPTPLHSLHTVSLTLSQPHNLHPVMTCPPFLLPICLSFLLPSLNNLFHFFFYSLLSFF